MANSKGDTYFIHDSERDFAERVRVDQLELTIRVMFERCYRTLHLIACRVLGGPERAEEAIASCWRIASRHPQQFEHKGEFRSWLLRVLIDQALVLLRERVSTPTSKVLYQTVPTQVFWRNGVSGPKGDVRTDAQNRFSQDFSVTLESRDKSVISMQGQISDERNQQTGS